MNPDTIKAMTPMFLGGVGGAIALAAMFSSASDQRFTQALGISGGFAAGAAGIAQQGNRQNTESGDIVNASEEKGG